MGELGTLRDKQTGVVYHIIHYQMSPTTGQIESLEARCENRILKIYLKAETNKIQFKKQYDIEGVITTLLNDWL